MSITVQQLRIDNWVKFEGKLYQIGAIYNSGQISLVGYEDGSVDISSLDPVELSEPILASIENFKRETPDDRDGMVFIVNKKFIVRQVNFGFLGNAQLGFAFELCENDDWCTVVSKVSSLHQLQNITYSLTETEIIYNPQSVTK